MDTFEINFFFYLTATKKHYAAESQCLDFAGETENSRKAINKWVEDQTEQKIKDLLQPGVINPGSTIMVLANAIYFKGNFCYFLRNLSQTALNQFLYRNVPE